MNSTPQGQAQVQSAGYESLLSSFTTIVCCGPLVLLGLLFIVLKATASSRSRSRKERELVPWKEAAVRDRQEWLANLGNTQDQRIASINQIIDRKDRVSRVAILSRSAYFGVACYFSHRRELMFLTGMGVRKDHLNSRVAQQRGEARFTARQLVVTRKQLVGDPSATTVLFHQTCLPLSSKKDFIS